MDLLVRRRWHISPDTDPPRPSTGAVIDGAEDCRRPLTRWPGPIPSHLHPCQKEYGRGERQGRGSLVGCLVRFHRLDSW